MSTAEWFLLFQIALNWAAIAWAIHVRRMFRVQSERIALLETCLDEIHGALVRPAEDTA